MIYIWKCPVCDERYESPSRRTEEQVIHEHFNRAVLMRRDYKAEGVLVDRFALRVGGSRWARREPLGPDEAHQHNEERRS